MITQLLSRKLEINLLPDGICVTFIKQFFFQKNKGLEIKFANASSCVLKEVRLGRGRATYLEITFDRHNKIRIYSTIRWFKKMTDYSANFSETDIAERYVEYRSQNKHC
jgi:hypothetical protein